MGSPTALDPAILPDLAHYRSHGIDRITAWCLTPFCDHQGTVTFDDLAAHGAGETTKLLAREAAAQMHKVRRPARRFAAGLVATEHRFAPVRPVTGNG